MKITSDRFQVCSFGHTHFVCFSVPDPRPIMDGVEDGKPYDIDIKPHRERRSLDANAYLWVLLDQLADKLSAPGTPVSKVDVYRELIVDVPGISTLVCVKDDAVDKLRTGWGANGIGWVSSTMPSKLPGCTNVTLYYGSSTFDSRQMSRLIDLTAEACKAQGIETMTPAELERLEGYGV